jgi:butyryl-CoA:acetate CoA-transferase
MSWAKEYQGKLVSPQEAVKIVKSDDWLDFTTFNGPPVALDQALAERKDELHRVKIRAAAATRPIVCVEADPERKHFIFNSWFLSKSERKLHDRNLCNYIPVDFYEMESIYRSLDVDVAMFQVAPMDENGYFNFGPQAPNTRPVVNQARKIIVEVNQQFPVALGNDEQIHISEVDYIVHSDNPPLVEVSSPPPNEVERAIAGHVIEHIHDGCCIQLGIGALPNLIGKLIAQSGIRHLGVHTEMLADSYVDLYEAGCIDGSMKVTDRRKMVYCFALGTKKLYDFIDHNPACSVNSGSYTNNPQVIAQNPNFIAINNCLDVDLFGQVSSESSGDRQISGTGGQWDFIKGAYMSEGGMGIICLASTFERKDGSRESRIRPTLIPGTIVTLSRYAVNYIATEFGMVNLKGASTWERAERLISIAHPGFRDELIKEADRMHIWVRSNHIEP